MKGRLSLLLLFWVCIEIPNYAQDADSVVIKEKVTISILPVAFYLPETELGLGATSMLTYDNFDDPNSDIPRVSRIIPSVGFTTKRQLLIYLPYELYFDKDQWILSGELGYYRYFYNFYGIGISSQKDDAETYDVTYPRLRFDGLRRLHPYISAGIVYRYDYYNIRGFKQGGLLDRNTYTGENGGTLSALGMKLQFDNRNDLFLPDKGILASVSMLFSDLAFGSAHDYSQISFSLSHFVGWSEQRMLAMELITGATIGEPPFYELFYIATTRQSRGTPDRRYIDRNMLTVQQEYRFPIYRRIGGVLFHSLSTVSDKWGKLWHNSHYVYALGFGLRYRLTKSRRARVRLDLGYSESDFRIYFTIGEAF